MDRERKIDLESLPEEQFVQVSEALRGKVSEKITQTIKDINKYLNVYGLEVLLGVQIVKQGEANLIKENIMNSSGDDLEGAES